MHIYCFFISIVKFETHQLNSTLTKLYQMAQRSGRPHTSSICVGHLLTKCQRPQTCKFLHATDLKAAREEYAAKSEFPYVCAFHPTCSNQECTYLHIDGVVPKDAGPSVSGPPVPVHPAWSHVAAQPPTPRPRRVRPPHVCVNMPAAFAAASKIRRQLNALSAIATGIAATKASLKGVAVSAVVASIDATIADVDSQTAGLITELQAVVASIDKVLVKYRGSDAPADETSSGEDDTTTE